MASSAGTEFVDVLIVGAGLSGIGSARHLQQACPDRSFLLLESRESLGGTWDLFRYPGIRSDSDMYTLGYSFKPWLARKALADGPAILSYLKETAAETGVDQHIRYGHKVLSAAWSSESATWTVSAERTDTGEPVEIACQFLLMCSGYYDYEKGYTPDFSGTEDFTGRIVHAQHWPENLDYRDKKVVVIGSGATAVTLVPELAKETAHTIMLQRSPTYIASVPEEDQTAARLQRFLPGSWVYRITRWKRVLFQIYIYALSRWKPELVKRFLLGQVREALGKDYDVKTHFTPSYNPWDQRLCAVPEGDMFTAIREQRAEVVTDHIERITDAGIKLQSGRELEADIIVLATGLNLKFMGGAQLTVDGEVVDPSELYVYRGMMFGNVPNLAQVFGYTNASWTLKSDLTGDFICRVLNYMKRTGTSVATPRLQAGTVEEEPMMNLSSGYVMRSVGKFPKQGAKLPWRLYQNYILDFLQLRLRPLRDKVLQFR
ncbi:FAD-containing monooxygenase EthA [Halioglobus japonicus]|nr:FAD-containing monooxygenase EthA [Halioglobus japonicus]